MSDQSNTALIQGLYAAFGRGDLQGILSTLADNVEWVVEGPSIIPFTGTRNGVAETTKFFESLSSTQTNQKLTINQTVAQGDLVASFGRYSGTVKSTNKSFDVTLAHLFTVKNGKVTRFVDIIDTAAMADAYQTASAAAR